MCSSDQTHEDTESATDSGTAGDAPEQNQVVGPLTDEELDASGMDRAVAFIRRERSKEAKRQARRREKLKGTKRQVNVIVPDDERSRATVRAAAAAIDDEVCDRAIEVLLANEDLRPVIVDMVERGELKDIVEVCRRSAAPDLFETVKAVSEHPDAGAAIRQIVGNSRRRATVEAALAHPAFVLLGEIVATQGGSCAWIARRVLGVRRRKPVSRGKRTADVGCR